MYRNTLEFDEITCDKCGTSRKAYGSNRGKQFFDAKWVANFRAKKYVHLCYSCQPKKMRATTDWAVKNL